MIGRQDSMTKAKQKRLILIGGIVLAVLLIIGLIFLLVKKPSNKEKESIKQEYSRSEEVVGIRFTFASEEHSLVKKNKKWQWEDQPNLGIDSGAIKKELKDLASNLQLDKYADSGKLSEYGLKDSTSSLTLEYKNGKETTFVVGGICGVNNYYVSINGEPEIYEASYELMELIDSLAAQRDIGEDMASEFFTNTDVVEE